jgi:hypothetical protein
VLKVQQLSRGGTTVTTAVVERTVAVVARVVMVRVERVVARA